MSPPYLPLPATKNIADTNPERLRAVVALTKSLYPSALIVPHVTDQQENTLELEKAQKELAAKRNALLALSKERAELLRKIADATDDLNAADAALMAAQRKAKRSETVAA